MPVVEPLTLAHRPKMNYAGFNQQTWTTVEIDDQFYQHWQWGEGPYYDWCDENCTGPYNIVKYCKTTVCGRFKNAEDATAFMLRWS